MITLQTGGATAAVGVVALLVAAWGAWLSLESSRRGPGWALAVVERWRPMPWIVVVVGGVALVAVDPVWVGAGILYVGLVVLVLTSMLRRSLGRVHEAYGGFDPSAASRPALGPSAGRALLAGGAVIAGLGVWDVAVRGWSGVFALGLAACLAAVGATLLRRSP